ncbi:hypothetical protein T190611E02C_11338 [Tenacibaculum sp. 190524A05c]|uniref:eCIS core domain-containing protein n=1 Tax=Tenacibaculum platacis TaxID=3137852 RepID=UPI0031FA8BBF
MFIRDKKHKQGNQNKEQNKSFIQPKLKMGKPGDKYEVEADKMADKVVNNSGTDANVQSKGMEEEVQQKPLASEVSPLIQKMEGAEEEQPVQKMEEEEAVQSKEEEEVQMMEEEEAVQSKEDEEVQMMEEEEAVQSKEDEEVQMMEEEEAVQSKEEEEVQAKCEACEGEEKAQKKEEEEVQAKETKGKANGAPSIENRLRRGSGGQKLDRQTQKEMESGFGADFSKVNIHNDAEAQQMSNDIGAQAFTHGNDIYFNEGKYNPNSKEGKHLLAHELTHTIQQKGMVQKKEISQTKNTVQRQPENSNPPADLGCPVATTSPTGSGETLSFPLAGSSFTAEQEQGINNFVRNWHVSQDPIRIDGYASMDGSETFNWYLSCRRAQSAKNALMAPPDGSPGIPASFITMFAHGETDQFGSLPQNRRVSINFPTPVNPIEPVQPTCDHPGESRDLVLQPVFLACGDNDADPTGRTFNTQLQKANEIWSKLGVNFTANSPITIDDCTNKTKGSTIPEIVTIGGLHSGSGIEVFFVDNDLAVAGGGASIVNRANSSVILSDFGTSSTLLAHELGHILTNSVGHPPANGVADSILVPSSSHSTPNSERNPIGNYAFIVFPSASGTTCLTPDP